MKDFLLFSKTLLRDKEHLLRVLFMTFLMVALVIWGMREEQAYLKQLYFLCSAWSLAMVLFIFGYSYYQRNEVE
ncbi:hypothetical protein ACFS7Z_11895 [Pontibacter toksunensis]|uniref:Uncharacterized protein n=1 Tax=Pontibacter toksunensis TaxID=1332631 RepID=A0ABW6BTF3_9BACT